jgi:hypothetical protein
VRRPFVEFRRALRTRIAAVVDEVLRTRSVAPGWDADSLALVVMALANGLALEALPDPDAVPPDVVPRVLGALAEVAPERHRPPANSAEDSGDLRRDLPGPTR